MDGSHWQAFTHSLHPVGHTVKCIMRISGLKKDWLIFAVWETCVGLNGDSANILEMFHSTKWTPNIKNPLNVITCSIKNHSSVMSLFNPQPSLFECVEHARVIEEHCMLANVTAILNIFPTACLSQSAWLLQSTILASLHLFAFCPWL